MNERKHKRYMYREGVELGDQRAQRKPAYLSDYACKVCKLKAGREEHICDEG